MLTPLPLLLVTPSTLLVRKRASHREADNLQTEVSARLRRTAEFEMVDKITGEIADENNGRSQPYAASTFAVETSISTDRPRKSKRTRIRSFAGSK